MPIINGGKTISKDLENHLPILSTDELFKLIDLYFSKHHILFAHQIASFNKFIEQYIPDYLTNNDNVFYEKYTDTKIIKYRLKFENIKIKPPTDAAGNILFPSKAREENLTYAANITADVTQIQEIYDAITRKIIGEPKLFDTSENVTVATVPIMVKSKYCSLNLFYDQAELDVESEYDPGCYFIINGAEKIVIPQERMVRNHALVFDPRNRTTEEIQINSENPTRDMNMQIMRLIYDPEKTELNIRVPIFNECPVIAIFKAYGIVRDDEIVDHIVYDKNDKEMIQLVNQAIMNSYDDNGNLITSQEIAIKYLTKILRVKKTFSANKEKAQLQRESYVYHLLQNIFLPHIPVSSEKIKYIGYALNKLLKVSLKRQEYDDRDSMVNKRLDMVGDLLFIIFRQHFRKMLNERKKYYAHRNTDDTNPINIAGDIKKNIIEKGLSTALSTGTFGPNKGVAQPLPRLTYLQSILILRRIDSPTSESSSSKLFAPRLFHPTQNGMICSIETPEHKDVGFIKQLTLIGSMTTGYFSQEDILYDMIKPHVKQLHTIVVQEVQNNTKVFVNGNWVGITSKPVELYLELKKAKYGGTLEATTSITYNDITNELHVWYDSGRLYRPVLRVENNEVLLQPAMVKKIMNPEDPNSIQTFEQFMATFPGVVEFIDCDEQVFSMIAPSNQDVEKAKQDEINSTKMAESGEYDVANRYGPMTYTSYSHCELHPSLLTGTIASTVPFLNHNNGARSILHYAQGKQAIGIYATNYRYRLDNSYLLYHPQQQLINTRTAKYTNYDALPPGENVVIAVMCYTGFNQEDSIIMNKKALERGLFRTTTYEKHISTLGKSSSANADDRFCNPEPEKTIGMTGEYGKLTSQGYPAEETIIEDGDVIIGKVSMIPDTDSPDDKKLKKPQRDMSEIYNHYFPAIVDKVWADSKDVNDHQMLKIRLRSERIPIIGDKFSTKSAQKGTVGLIMEGQDMPVSHNGLVPDIIFNPSSIHGRMTMGFMMECLFGKAAGLTGAHYDATAFVDADYHVVQEVLKSHGFNMNGTEKFTNGMTGEEITSLIFTGPMYYLRLKQMVADKVHCLSVADHEVLTREGWLKADQLTNDTEVATLVDNELIYQKPIKIYRYDSYDGTMYQVDHPRISLKTTTNHMMLIREDHQDKQVMASEIFNKNATYRTLVENYAGNLPHESVANFGDIDVLQFSRKGIPEWAKFAPREYASKIVHVILNTRSIKLTDCFRLTESKQHKKFVDDFMQLCIHAGYCATATLTDSCYVIHVYQDEPEVNMETLKTDQIIFEKCPVFCLTVPGHVFYIRNIANGNLRGCWTGNSRATGPHTSTMRQPSEGRSKHGGLRIGEMERDCLLAHGMSQYTKEKLIDTSDKYDAHICEQCGAFANRIIRPENHIMSSDSDIYKCKRCGGVKIYTVKIPYAFKLLTQELAAMNIGTKLQLQ